MRILSTCHAHNSLAALNDETIRIGRTIKSELARRGETQGSAALLFKVKQSSVCRVLKGNFTHRSQLACRMRAHYLDETTDSAYYAHSRGAERAFDEVVEALSGFWDGTVEGAHRLKAVVDVVRWLKEGN
jgi:predicted XRE-type DNA-binding protein